MKAIIFHPDGLDDLERSSDIQAELLRVARELQADMHPPSKFQTWARAGSHGHDGHAFAQAGFSGDGALAIEFGSIHGPALSPVRSAVARRRIG